MKTVKITFIFITLALSLMTANAQMDYLGIMCSAGVIHSRQPGMNGMHQLVREKPAYSWSNGFVFHFDGFSVGFGHTYVNYESEIQGVFPETNQFGVARIRSSLSYWTMPLSLRLVYFDNSSLSLTYTPGFLGFTKQEILTAGGAEYSDYMKEYPEDFAPFQHSLVCSYIKLVGRRHGTFFLALKPYIGIGSGYFTHQKQAVANVMYGININFLLESENLTIDWYSHDNPSWNNRQNDLKKKQEEIEKKLNKIQNKQI